MKWYKKLFIGIGAFFAAILVFCLVVIISGTCFRGYKEPEDDSGSTWMSRLDDNKKITEVIIPGSHDSCTYSMPWLAATQYLNIEQQLESGSRYFDIRVNKVDEQYVIYHGPINGVQFEPIIDSIKTFITTYSSEFLILDFQHFDNGSQDHVFDVVQEKLGDVVIKNNTEDSDLKFVDSLTVGQCRGKCLILFGYGSYENEDFIFRRNNDECSNKGCSLDSCYYTERNSKDSKTYIDESLPFYIDEIKRKINEEGYKGLFVLQGQLTDGLLIFGPYSKEVTHEKNMSEYIINLKDNPDFSLINIIMRDFIDYTKCSEIFNLNF